MWMHQVKDAHTVTLCSISCLPWHSDRAAANAAHLRVSMLTLPRSATQPVRQLVMTQAVPDSCLLLS